MSKIEFIEEGHKYVKNDMEYTSVSKVISVVEPAFPAQIIAKNIAKSQGVSVEEVLQEWKRKRDMASEIGNDIHHALDEYSKNGKARDAYWNRMAEDLEAKLFSGYNAVDSEFILHSDKYLAAGTADRLCYRNKNVIDIRDFKTNETKGIQYCDKYNKFMTDPMGYLENTNYNRYAFQLSCYGVLVEEQLRYKIGNLALIYIPPVDPMNWQYIPVPYMKREAEILLMQNKINKSN